MLIFIAVHMSVVSCPSVCLMYMLIYMQETSLYLTHGSSLVSTLLSMASSLCSGEQSLEESLQPLVDFYSDISLTRNTVMVNLNVPKLIDSV